MSNQYATLLGKAVQKIARLRGGGSALPGLFVEKIDPQFITRTLAQLPQGVVVISGTNGKTTTTKMVVELLESQGLKVFTNRTGSNFTRGVAAALLSAVDAKGKLAADIAVLELDEAHAVHFVKAVAPRYSLLLNVMRDQLDRFGEIDTTAKLLTTLAQHTSDTVVINREDPRLRTLGQQLTAQDIQYFGLSQALSKLFPSDDEMRSVQKQTDHTDLFAPVVLSKINDHTATFIINGKGYELSLKLRGVYNIYNAAAALALALAITGKSTNIERMLEALSHVTPAFGRGETITIGGQPLELVLVKNPSGFRLSLSSFSPAGYSTMIAINDNYADGRDMSWLWDVEFDSLKPEGVAYISGIRAYDMALRLQYEDVAVSQVQPNLSLALRQFIADTPSQPKRIYCTYTAMLALRRELAKITSVETIT